MRILFLESNPMWIHGLPNGFSDIGHEVMVSGELTKRSICRILSSFRPDMVITMGWTKENTGYKPTIIRKYVKALGIPHVYWATEDPTHTQSFTLPLIKRMQPNFIFTICPSNVDYYTSLGIQSAHMDFGFHKSVNHYVTAENNFKTKIAVVANGYPKILELYPNHYRIKSIQALISPLIKENIRVDFWGSGWDQMDKIIGKNIDPSWIHGKLPYVEASKVYSSSDIVIGIQNHLTQLNQRIYEVLASKGFLLTSDTPEIRRLFKPNKDLVVSSSPKETINLVQYYLKNKEERERIRNQGEVSVKMHSYSNRALYMLKVLNDNKIL